jgi:hypothetical protein
MTLIAACGRAFAHRLNPIPKLGNRRRARPYSRSEVIHRAGDKSPPFFEAFERERPRIVNNFAASASPGYELSSFLAR